MRRLIAVVIAGLTLGGCYPFASRTAETAYVAAPAPAAPPQVPGRCFASDPYGARMRIPC